MFGLKLELGSVRNLRPIGFVGEIAAVVKQPVPSPELAEQNRIDLEQVRHAAPVLRRRHVAQNFAVIENHRLDVYRLRAIHCASTSIFSRPLIFSPMN